MSVKRLLLGILCVVCCFNLRAESIDPDSYNIVIILADDLGYGDLKCFGGKVATPNIDRLAASGMKLTSFYTSPICSPSRASLLTGCYPQRIGVPSVIGGNSREGINSSEKLLSEMLKEKGYRTALFGKWHLGRREIYHPQNHGFDEFFGTLASNDDGSDMSLASRRYGHAELALYEGRDTVAINPKQWELTRQYTKRSVDFLTKNKQNPFFLYLAYNAPHTPLFVDSEFAGQSKIGIYQDVLMEIDWSVGEIMESLKKNELLEKTLVVFMSDNGPWAIFGNHAGSGKPFSGSKKQTLEGGVRVPCILSLPGIILPGNESNELVTMMDLYPTIAALTDSKMSTKIIDGKNLLPLIKGEKDTKSAYDAYYYYYRNALQAVRAGSYKLQLPYEDMEAPDPEHPGYDGHRGDVRKIVRHLALFDLNKDLEESIDLSAQNPEMVKKLLKVADEARRKLGDSITGVKGAEVRSEMK